MAGVGLVSSWPDINISCTDESVDIHLHNDGNIEELEHKDIDMQENSERAHSYEKEVEKEFAKTADMKAKGSDPYDLKQQENVLAESRMMVPDCRKRLETALSDLKATLVEVEESGQKDGSEIGDARSTITEIERIF